MLTYGASIIALIRDGILSWTSEVEYYSKICLELEEEKYDDKMKKLFQAYANLMEAFRIFDKIFKFTILFQTLGTFFYSLMFLQATVKIIETGMTQIGSHDVLTNEIVTLLLTIKNFAFISLFSVFCEKYYMSLSEVDASCSRLLKSLQSTVEAKKLCKNVQRLNRAAFEEMTACRMFIIDGRLPLKFNSLVLEYAVVILQFAVVSWKKQMKQN